VVDTRTIHGSSFFRVARKLSRTAALLSFALMFTALNAQAQRRKRIPAHNKNVETSQIAKLRQEYINATKEYKGSLEKLAPLYEANQKKAEERLVQSRQLFAQGLISKRELDESERALNDAKAKVDEVRKQIAGADTQIAQALVEVQGEKQLARARLPKGGLLKTTSFIRFNGTSAWSLSDAGKIESFFLQKFGRALPIAVFGQGAIHNQWHLDHRNAMDISLHPDSAEGQALMTFLTNNGIPFSAFRGAIPGTATGPHIHIGRPSHRY
jgi:Outer membrane efflux protein